MPDFIVNWKLIYLLAFIAAWHMMAYRGISFLPMVVKKVVKSKNSSILLLDIFNAFLNFSSFSEHLCPASLEMVIFGQPYTTCKITLF